MGNFRIRPNLPLFCFATLPLCHLCIFRIFMNLPGIWHHAFRSKGVTRWELVQQIGFATLKTGLGIFNVDANTIKPLIKASEKKKDTWTRKWTWNYGFESFQHASFKFRPLHARNNFMTNMAMRFVRERNSWRARPTFSARTTRIEMGPTVWHQKQKGTWINAQKRHFLKQKSQNYDSHNCFCS